MIIDHPKICFEDSRGFQHPCKVVQCDFCPNMGPTAKDIGGAAEEARSKGFATVRGRSLASPRKWMCKGCRKITSTRTQA